MPQRQSRPVPFHPPSDRDKPTSLHIDFQHRSSFLPFPCAPACPSVASYHPGQATKLNMLGHGSLIISLELRGAHRAS